MQKLQQNNWKTDPECSAGSVAFDFITVTAIYINILKQDWIENLRLAAVGFVIAVPL